MYQFEKLVERFTKVRRKSMDLCAPLETEDYVVQPISDVSPPKWHLGHTTWFFEELILKKFVNGYMRYDESFPLLFNSYYKSAGEHWLQSERGNLSRPTVRQVTEYRHHVDGVMTELLKMGDFSTELLHLLEVGLNHEEQHQELLLMDIKYILGCNPAKPAYGDVEEFDQNSAGDKWHEYSESLCEIGHSGESFAYDNEMPRHKHYQEAFAIRESLVTNAEFLNFIEDGGYENPKYWLSLGWDWLNKEKVSHPLYWRNDREQWLEYKLNGEGPLDLNAPVRHVSYFEADAFANWAGLRLPTEHELELHFEAQGSDREHLWSWSKSHYSAYPGFERFSGKLEEYNGKFMCNQFVLKGGCLATSENHHRHTYRNFFAPEKRWMFSGIRLAK
jgi:ergothioneine biosynthesis protein EgtB